MGSVFGRKFVRNDKIDGQGKSLLLFAKVIHLQKEELNRIYEEFCRIEDPQTHIAPTSSIITSKKKPYSLIASVLLQIFDQNKLGVVNFLDYLRIMWCFLSANEDELARTCFSLFDIYKTRSLDIGEVKYLINVIWEFQPNKRCVAAMSRLDLNTDGLITIEEFVLLNRHFKVLLRPIRELQRHVQRKTVFRRFWKQITQRRVEFFGARSMFDIVGLTDPSYVASSMEYLNLRTDVVPAQFIEQWNFIQRRKANRGILHPDLPYEITEILHPLPLNVPPKTTLRSVAKSIGLWARYSKKKNKGSRRNSQVAVDDTDIDPQPLNKANSATMKANGEGEEDSTEFENFDVVNAPPTFPRAAKKAPFDDSYLGSQKGVTESSYR